MIDPTIAAAIISASGGLLGKLLELAGKTDPPTELAKKTIDKTYDKLQAAITTNSLRVLIALRNVGAKQSSGMILPAVKEMQQRQEPGGDAFEADLDLSVLVGTDPDYVQRICNHPTRHCVHQPSSRRQIKLLIGFRIVPRVPALQACVMRSLRADGTPITNPPKGPRPWRSARYH
ncbi:hypothetical protein BJG93_36625 (plasmid) [Paraburkholderia sprentiae WSM5005]|uniref:Uncharacterized protein n=1 Tax=Paraburkholderia sprentiae WSM5005 TaxID=754502 RepID=A0A8F4KIJ9_9BURK|nr:hypothetical protein [Paraburkholderia sprentiae]QXE07375.1 hypothetical protein BJG93_36625 [Paraburkholderia sprentiae WSM5005]